MTRLQACIDALKSPHPSGLIDAEEAIAIITRILSAEPTPEEIERCAEAIFKEYYPTGYGKIANYNAAEESHKNNLRRNARTLLLTAFPQQEKL